ncbi:hypothetical protein ACFOY4_05015 [Actinomadura syzygii]|uniref:Uncharacterized protein n=1 Tax=Actinomadura syzygii TaxID=1427538 RepID=A0A5D0TW08_9ACTN|nr:hypothetical protein [Actinomadura syzygii]TYC10047.1 hypothetical protein FXF65_33685 [Actinomadura syzygii]
MIALSTADPKAWLKGAHPHWSIVESDKHRWWAFLDMDQRGTYAVPVRTTDVNADTPEELHDLLTKAES